MRRAWLGLSLLLLTFPAVAALGIEEEVVCFPDAVVINPVLNHVHFVGFACNVGVNYVFASKQLAGSTLEWTITAPQGMQHCVFTDIVQCNSTADVPVTQGDRVEFDVQLSDGGPIANVLFIGAQLL
ncbi:MAG: hypothetical protein LC624_09470 [Halobacteriales archaeon]|nr:hypothetical protein [Halobacteriales archaeon]